MNELALAGNDTLTVHERAPWLDRTMYPFVSRDIPLAAGVMHYVDEGAGEPIVFVHGTPTWSFLWRHAIASLRATHRVIAPDHLGFGLSEKPGDCTPAAHAANLAELIGRLGLRRITLVAHDFGGPIAMAYALAHPENVARIAIVNSWMWNHDDPRIRRMSRLVASPIGKWLYFGLNASPRFIIPSAYADRRKLTPAIHRHYMMPFARRRDRMATWVLGRELTGSDAFFDSLWTRRAAIGSTPLLLAWGARDPAFGTGYRDRWLAAFPHAQHVGFPNAGHFVQEEAPEELTATLASFVSAT